MREALCQELFLYLELVGDGLYYLCGYVLKLVNNLLGSVGVFYSPPNSQAYNQNTYQ